MICVTGHQRRLMRALVMTSVVLRRVRNRLRIIIIIIQTDIMGNKWRLLDCISTI